MLGFLTSCKNSTDKTYAPERKQLKEELLEVNKILVEKDQERIKAYAKRRGWEMNRNESGLWHMKTSSGNGDSVRIGEKVALNYTLELLDGTFCYSSDSNGVKEFIVGKGGVERGLEDAVLLYKGGDKANLILPPHLAHGLIGDENCIPARATLIYEIEILE
jgi:FKBP-type peptidyl-prolyl cis-trans isomerase